ncbi:MAG TPA: triphosphoribosyl-dephospho-CoA synthase [Candidatus Acidoferrales bacterium]|nr:triphosphoribosyl-dephospho-CoA synthase [Candidatus Acidoferrales bacterium]
MVGWPVQPANEISELVMSVCALVDTSRLATSRAGNCERSSSAEFLAGGAVWSLIEEANLTPKPALVDARGYGAHSDMNLGMLHRSARSLWGTFAGIADEAWGAGESICLRERLAQLGREGERNMLRTTGGVNTHRGAIWTLGLLCAAAAMLAGKRNSAEEICAQGARIARLPDGYTSRTKSHGEQACEQFGVRGARGEAESGFHHIVEVGLPMLKSSRSLGLTEGSARLNALVAIMADLDDTCLLHRGGLTALAVTKLRAKTILQLGGASTADGFRALCDLHRRLVHLNASPGGSADLLAGVLFLDFIERNFDLQREEIGNVAF